jgi:hypothetical protein
VKEWFSENQKKLKKVDFHYRKLDPREEIRHPLDKIITLSKVFLKMELIIWTKRSDLNFFSIKKLTVTLQILKNSIPLILDLTRFFAFSTGIGSNIGSIF